jgi:hypothetical protein
MTKLIKFLLARFAEDEEVAKSHGGLGEWAAEYTPPKPPVEAGRWNVVSAERDRHVPDLPAERVVEAYLSFPYGGERSTVQHIARWDPARALAEVDSKRRIVHDLGGFFGMSDFEAGLIEHTFRLLALPYADHPDFNPDWRP